MQQRKIREINYDKLQNFKTQTPWSFSTTKKITGTPKIYITDMTTKKRYRATQVRNFGTTFYGDGYTTTITYQPGKTKLINTHKYKVKIGKYYTYTFRFFRQKGHLKQKIKSSYFAINTQ